MEGLVAAAQKVNDKQLVSKIETMFDDEDMLEKLKKEVMEEALMASMSGVHGVPSFEFDGEFVFSGAQPVDTFVASLRQYAR